MQADHEERGLKGRRKKGSQSIALLCLLAYHAQAAPLIQVYLQNQSLQWGTWDQGWGWGMGVPLCKGLSFHAHCPYVQPKHLLHFRLHRLSAFQLPGSVYYLSIGYRQFGSGRYGIGIFPFATLLSDQKFSWQSSGLSLELRTLFSEWSVCTEFCNPKPSYAPQLLSGQIQWKTLLFHDFLPCRLKNTLLTVCYGAEPNNLCRHGSIGLAAPLWLQLPYVPCLQFGVLLHYFQLQLGWRRWLQFSLRLSSLPEFIPSGLFRTRKKGRRAVPKSPVTPVQFPYWLHSGLEAAMLRNFLKPLGGNPGTTLTSRSVSGHQTAQPSSKNLQQGASPQPIQAVLKADLSKLHDHFRRGNYPKSIYQSGVAHVKGVHGQRCLDDVISIFALNQKILGASFPSECDTLAGQLRQRLTADVQAKTDGLTDNQHWAQVCNGVFAEVGKFGLRYCQHIGGDQFGYRASSISEIKRWQKLSHAFDQLGQSTEIPKEGWETYLCRVWSRAYLESLLVVRQAAVLRHTGLHYEALLHVQPYFSTEKIDACQEDGQGDLQAYWRNALCNVNQYTTAWLAGVQSNTSARTPASRAYLASLSWIHQSMQRDPKGGFRLHPSAKSALKSLGDRAQNLWDPDCIYPRFIPAH